MQPRFCVVIYVVYPIVIRGRLHDNVDIVLHRFFNICKYTEPVCVQTLFSKTAIERSNRAALVWLLLTAVLGLPAGL